MSWEEKGTHLTEFAKEMKNSGHKEKFRQEVMTRAVKKYEKDLRDHENRTKNMYRNREERELEKEQKGGEMKKDSWFRKKEVRGQQKTTSILRVPYTAGILKQKMANILKRVKQPKGTHAVAHEDNGDKLHHQLLRPDPFPASTCGRTECKTKVKGVAGECKGTCWQNHVNYTVMCKKCEEDRIQRSNTNSDKKHIYLGETSRGCFTRFSDEKKACRPKTKNFMYQHVIEKHEGDIGNEFVIKRENIDKDPMRRVIRESVRIRRAEEDESIILMNTKEEHFGVQTIRGNFSKDWAGL